MRATCDDDNTPDAPFPGPRTTAETEARPRRALPPLMRLRCQRCRLRTGARTSQTTGHKLASSVCTNKPKQSMRTHPPSPPAPPRWCTDTPAPEDYLYSWKRGLTLPRRSPCTRRCRRRRHPVGTSPAKSRQHHVISTPVKTRCPILPLPTSRISQYKPGDTTGDTRASDKMPPPQPTSTTRRPANGEPAGPTATAAPARPCWTYDAARRISGMRTWFIWCKPTYGPLGFHHAEPRRAKRSISAASTDDELGRGGGVTGGDGGRAPAVVAVVAVVLAVRVATRATVTNAAGTRRAAAATLAGKVIICSQIGNRQTMWIACALLLAALAVPGKATPGLSCVSDTGNYVF